LRPRILFLVPAEYDALCSKGVDRMILERDEGGFFERVVTVHPLAMQDRVIDLNAVHRLYEFDAGTYLTPARIRGLLALPFRLVSIVRSLLRIVHEERIDVIRATDVYVMGMLAWIVARLGRIPFCVSIHAPYDERFALTPKSGVRRFRRRAASLLPRFVMRRADLVLPIRQHLAEAAIAGGAASDRVRVIPHGIDMGPFDTDSHFDVRSELNVPDDAAIISFVGRLAGDNYIDDLLTIAGRLAARRRDFVVVIAGGGELAPRVEQWLAADPQVARQVRVVGFWPYSKVVALRKASLAALALMGGYSLIEACAAGCVPVAYDVEWHSEIVIDGTSGFLAPAGDIDAAVGALERLLDDRPLAARMGSHARALALERHDLRRTSQIKREVYQQLMARTSRAGVAR
jgi:glycosyltransferase involved in cell wall biosynthesis